MYEARHQPPISRRAFLRRMLRHGLFVVGLLLVSLAIGIAGYAWTEGLPPLDGFLNAAMLLGGMGPVNAPRTPAGKLFAGCYALYAGLVFIVTATLLATPVLHRLLHRFHYDR